MTGLTISWLALAMVISAEKAEPENRLPAPFARLLPLHTKLGSPQPGDWLAEHKEPGQSYAAVPSQPANPRRPAAAGDLCATARRVRCGPGKVLERTAEFLGLYFQLPVKVREGLSLDLIPAAARREHPTWHVKQILTTYVLDDVLRPRLPASACAYIALTTSDLWPGEGWNFVFGQASLSERVGVWSIAGTAIPTATRQPFDCA